jgi:hypothetical protein
LQQVVRFGSPDLDIAAKHLAVRPDLGVEMHWPLGRVERKGLEHQLSGEGFGCVAVERPLSN